MGTFVLLGFMLAARPRDLRAPLADPRDGITIAAAGLVGLAAGSLLYVYALLEVGAARSAVLSATSPLFAIPLAILVLGEQLTVRVLIGTLVTVGGIVVVVTL